MNDFAKAKTPRGPAGKRCYAIGDVHGRLDLLKKLLGQIEQHITQLPPKETSIVMLGDLIDRGPNSNEVVEFARTFRPGFARLFVLCGNHEELLLRTLEGDLGAFQTWIASGGVETMQSYGLDPDRLTGFDLEASRRYVADAIPASHATFLRSGADSIRFGDYLLVHAGIRPGQPLQDQAPKDLRWIRKTFLNSEADHGFLVVHGHSQATEIEVRPNRIGIDTGAYHSGILTAAWFEDDQRGFIQARDESGDYDRSDLFEEAD